MEYVLRTHDLVKKYDNKIVVDHLNLNVKKGEIYGFIGKNGAGKSTSIKMILGLIKPLEGTIEIFGETIKPRQYKHYERIGSIVDVAGFYPNLTAIENLEIHRLLMGIPDKKCINSCIEVVGLNKETSKKVKDYSLGMKQRLGIARALLYQPELLILDEPTNGLDPVGMKEIRELILRLSKRSQMTIFLSTHILSEVQQISSTIGIIHKGVLIEEICFEDFQKKNSQFIQLKVVNDRMAAYVLEKELNIIDYSVVEPGVIRIYDVIEDTSYLNRKLIENGIDFKESVTMKNSLEDYFVNLTGGEING
jgi:bacitracin transport system ATP-binding protein